MLFIGAYTILFLFAASYIGTSVYEKKIIPLRLNFPVS